MQCNRPIWLSSYELFVPCGKCRACRIARSREWATRLVHECAFHESSVFATLTYDEEHLPKGASLDKREWQLFMKRLRKNTEGREMKYFAAGEYGDKNGRPHYHACIFGVALDEKEVIEDAWQHRGMVHVGNVEYDSARYICDYIQKDNRAMMYGGRTPPFSLMSRGLGRKYIEKYGDQVIANGGVTVRGIPCGLPRYYRNFLGERLPTGVLLEKKEERLKELREAYERKKLDKEETWKAVKNGRMQKEEDIEKRIELNRRKM